MAYSGVISGKDFTALKAVDTAFRRCKISAQSITAEMHSYALDALSFILNGLANSATPPSWTLQVVLLPFYHANPVVLFPIGTVTTTQVNVRTMQMLTGTVTTASTSYQVQFSEQKTVKTVGLVWSGTPVDLTAQVSDDGIAWTTVGVIAAADQARQWTDIEAAKPHLYFRLTAVSAIDVDVLLANDQGTEVPVGTLNSQTYDTQANKSYQGRPVTAWFQRDIPQPALNFWPAPNENAQNQMCVVARVQRHIMDVQNLRQEIQIPQRWQDALISELAAKVAEETPSVNEDVIARLRATANAAMAAAWGGDSDGSPTFLQPQLSVYTR